MAYDEDQEVKDVVATILVKMKIRTTLLGSDYNQSDGTDRGALLVAFADVGFDDWEEIELHEILYCDARFSESFVQHI